MSNLIHIPKELLPIVVIDGREFFFVRERFQFQCAVCLNVMQVVPGKIDKRRSRALYIDSYCYCQTIGTEESGPVHAITPKDLEDERQKPLKDKVGALISDENDEAS